MADHPNFDLADDHTFLTLVQGIADLQSLACDIDMERQDKQSSISQEERHQSINDDNKEESLKIIKKTTDIARLAMILLVRGLRTCALHASKKSKCFNSFSSAIAYIRGQEQGVYVAPKHLLLQWERNVTLIDLFTSDEGLYCNKRIAQTMFDSCMETFDWLHSLANNNK